MFSSVIVLLSATSHEEKSCTSFFVIFILKNLKFDTLTFMSIFLHGIEYRYIPRYCIEV